MVCLLHRTMREEGEADVRLWVGLAGRRTIGEKTIPQMLLVNQQKPHVSFW